VSEQDPPELPHEGPPYQGYGPAPYQPPAPVPPPTPPGWSQPVQQAAPSIDPPPPIAQPVPEPGARRQVSDPAEGEVLQKWGYVMAFSALFFPILGLVGLVLGILTATKPHRERHGVAIICISVALGILAVALWSSVSDS
jgi:hypothetical protein